MRPEKCKCKQFATAFVVLAACVMKYKTTLRHGLNPTPPSRAQHVATHSDHCQIDLQTHSESKFTEKYESKKGFSKLDSKKKLGYCITFTQKFSQKCTISFNLF